MSTGVALQSLSPFPLFFHLGEKKENNNKYLVKGE